MSLASKQATAGDGITGAMFALLYDGEKAFPFLRTMIDYADENEDDHERPY